MSAKKVAAKSVKVAKVAPVAAKQEGLTKETVATGVIAFKAGSGSQDLLNLIAKLGFDKVAVLAAAEKLSKAGKAFVKSVPAKKYTKVAGIIKRLQNAGYKLPQVA
jgi:hypothetical protein